MANTGNGVTTEVVMQWVGDERACTWYQLSFSHSKRAIRALCEIVVYLGHGCVSQTGALSHFHLQEWQEILEALWDWERFPLSVRLALGNVANIAANKRQQRQRTLWRQSVDDNDEDDNDEGDNRLVHFLTFNQRQPQQSFPLSGFKF